MTPRSTPRRKKTRYLSLRRRLAAAASTAPMVASSIPDHTQLDLFPLRPEPAETALPNDPHDEHLSRFFPSDDAITLHSLLGTHFPSSPATASEGHISPSSSSANYSACSSSYGSGGAATAAAAGLARAALRGRERWWAEEEEESEAASGSGGLLSSATRRLSLKLDYDGILSAWPGERPLFVNGDGLQVVPDLHHTAAPLQYSTVFVDVGGGSAGGGGVWTVPDGGGAAAEEGEEDLEEAGQGREARVMRYREKRRHRLFSKRIRYEVRKLNAERRPRLKGRFVKRDDDV